VAQLASRQHGVVSRGQLLGLGLSEDQIDMALEASGLHRVFRGAYAVGHPGIGRLGRMKAATLACGPDAVISHGTAAALLGLTERSPVLIHLIGANDRGREIPGVRRHRVHPPHPDEVTSRQGIACTTASRTLVDLAGSVGTKTLRGLIEEAAVQRSLDVAMVDRILGRSRRRGAPRLRALLDPWRLDADDAPLLRSRLEARLWPRLVELGLSLPRTNVTLDLNEARLEVDFVWDERRLVVETDGAASHATPSAFGRDRRRDQILVAAGYRVIRVTWDQLSDEPEAVLARILRILGA
jgi:very-short-patch-repair endonuclease